MLNKFMDSLSQGVIDQERWALARALVDSPYPTAYAAAKEVYGLDVSGKSFWGVYYAAKVVRGELLRFLGVDSDAMAVRVLGGEEVQVPYGLVEHVERLVSLEAKARGQSVRTKILMWLE